MSVIKGREAGGEELCLEESALGELLSSLAVVPDPRHKRGVRHTIKNVLAIAILGCICGCDSADALEDWGAKESAWLSRFLDLEEHGTPSQDVFLRVFAALDPRKFRAAFSGWAARIFHAIGVNPQIAIDGQTYRGSGSRRTGMDPLHMVSALACDVGLVLGQIKTSEKSNEITAIPELLRTLDLRDALVSIDAMGCQVSIAKEIVDGGGDYLFGLKGNQGTLRDQVEALFQAADQDPHKNIDRAQPPQAARITETDKGHGRIETRTASVICDFGDWIPAADRWPKLQTLIAIDSTRVDVISGHETKERRYYISSRKLAPDAAILHTRQHWHIENQLHWCLDVTFGQDSQQTRTAHAAENLGVVRQLALNVLKRHKGDRYSVSRRRRFCDYHVEYREALLGLQPRQ